MVVHLGARIVVVPTPYSNEPCPSKSSQQTKEVNHRNSANKQTGVGKCVASKLVILPAGANRTVEKSVYLRM